MMQTFLTWIGNISPLFWTWVGNVSALLGLFGSIGALLALHQARKISADVEREKQRLNQEVFIVLKSTGNETNKIRIPFALRRGEITRSEILGLIGMLPKREGGFNQPRFAIHFLSTKDFRIEMSRIQDSSVIFELVIPCNNDEIGQFDSDKIERT